MTFTINSWDEYVENFLKPMLANMDEELFKKFLMKSPTGEELEFQTMDSLKRVLNIVKDDDKFVDKEIMILREMERTKQYELNLKEE